MLSGQTIESTFDLDPDTLHLIEDRPVATQRNLMGGLSFEPLEHLHQISISGRVLSSRPPLLQEEIVIKRDDTTPASEEFTKPEPPSVFQEWVAEIATPLKELPQEAPVQTVFVSTTDRWLEILADAKDQGKQTWCCDDPKIRALGFVVNEDNTLFHVNLSSLRDAQISVQTAARFIPDGNVDILKDWLKSPEGRSRLCTSNHVGVGFANVPARELDEHTMALFQAQCVLDAAKERWDEDPDLSCVFGERPPTDTEAVLARYKGMGQSSERTI
jgi:hypothetical protein